jgi:hypothetical protein
MSELQDDPTKGEPTEELENQPSVEDLQAQLAQKEDDIQKLKGSFGSKNDASQREIRELETKFATLEGRVTEQNTFLTANKEPEANPYALTDEQTEDFNNNPAKMAEYFRKVSDAKEEKLIGTFGAALQARDTYLDTSLDNVRSRMDAVKNETDPETVPWREAIAELRKNEAFAGLDDKVLIEFAKSKGTEPSMQYKGDAGGQRQRAVVEKVQPFNPNSKQGQLVLAAEKGNMEKAEALWSRMEAKRIG